MSTAVERAAKGSIASMGKSGQIKYDGAGTVNEALLGDKHVASIVAYTNTAISVTKTTLNCPLITLEQGWIAGDPIVINIPAGMVYVGELLEFEITSGYGIMTLGE